MYAGEKRKYIRLNKIFPVELKVIDLQNKPISDLLQGFTRDLSHEGVCIEINNFSDEYVEALKKKQTKILLFLNIPYKRIPVKAIASVVWARKVAMPHPQTYLLGMAYEVIDDEEQKRIIRFAKFNRWLPRLIALCLGLLILISGYLFFKNIILTQRNKLLVQKLTQLSDEQVEFRRQLDKVGVEKLIVADLLKSHGRESKILREQLIELEKTKAKMEKEKNEGALAKLIKERQELEQKLVLLIKQKSQLEERLSGYDKSETELKAKLVEIEGDKVLLENRSLQLMYQWLISSQNSKTGLVVSYDRDPGLLDVGFTYDQALSAFNFIHFEEHEKARMIFDFFKYKAKKINGGFANGYDVVTGQVSEYIVHSGPSIYLGLAMLSYEEATGDDKYLDVAAAIGDWLVELQSKNKLGALPGGPDLKWTATEHNISAYAFFSKLFRKTFNYKYDIARGKILSWLKEFAYYDKFKRFNRGGDDRMIATDIIALSIMALGPKQLKAMGIPVEDLINSIEENCKTRIQFENILKQRVSITGFDFCNPSSIGRAGIISVEWTAQMIVAFQELSRYYRNENDDVKALIYERKARYYLGELEKLLLIRSAFGSQQGSGGFPYATDTGIDTGHGWYTPNRDSISAASTNFVIFAKEEFNIFEI